MAYQASIPTEVSNSGSSSSNSAAPSSSSQVDSQAGDLLVFACPHGCGVHIAVNKSDINCGIFRCGANTITGVQLAPHATKQECDAASLEAGFVGCGRPFKFDGTTAAVCGYI
jgi:hypothetical protein